MTIKKYSKKHTCIITKYMISKKKKKTKYLPGNLMFTGIIYVLSWQFVWVKYTLPWGFLQVLTFIHH